uniref:Vexin n=1 Tax=Serinus canaria TaxID=9135 RepID=A0A8C9NLN6_SERCA
MHQIYSCSDENLEVFTVISSKSCSPARRRAKASQHILAKSVRKISFPLPILFFPHILVEPLLIPDLPVPGLGQARPHPFSQAQAHRSALGSVGLVAISREEGPGRSTLHTLCVLLVSHRQRWRKTTEYDLSLPPGAEASIPLTGGNLCGTPSLLRKMWMKHKKKSEYLGATNSAFEAD